MPMINNMEGTLVKNYSPLISSHFSGPNESYVSVSKIIAKHQESFLGLNEDGFLSPHIRINSERSRLSQELNTVSREFKKFLIEYSQNHKFLVQKEYKIFVWTNNREYLRKLFPERTVYEKIEIENSSENVTFIIYTSSPPVIIDCVLYLLIKIEDFKEVYNLNQKFKHVWTQGLISSVDHPNFAEIAQTLGITIFRNLKELYRTICADDLRLYNMLKEVFNKIDSNQSGEIEFSELFNAIRHIQEDITYDDIKEAIARIDINNDGKISFEEFCFWWKKGRHGAISVSEVALNWAKQITLNTPETKSLLKNIIKNRALIEKKTIRKEILLKIGTLNEKNSEVIIEIGKSAVREKLLNEVNMKLGLFSQDLWIAIRLVAKNPGNLQVYEASLKKSIELVLESMFSNLMDGKKIKKAVKYSIKAINEELFLVFTLDLTDSYLEPLNKLFITLDELLVSPLNDHFFLQIDSENPFFKLISNGFLLENLGNCEIKANAEYWSKFVSILLSLFPILSNKIAFIYSFLITSGKVQLDFESIHLFAELFSQVIGRKPEVNHLLSPSFMSLLQQLDNKFEDGIEVYTRASNIGLKLRIVSKDLISSILINGWTNRAEVLY